MGSSVRLKDDGASSQLHTVKKNRQIDSVERKKKKFWSFLDLSFCVAKKFVKLKQWQNVVPFGGETSYGH